MIKIRDAAIANSAVLGSQWSETLTAMAKSGQNNVALFPLIEVRNLNDKKYDFIQRNVCSTILLVH